MFLNFLVVFIIVGIDGIHAQYSFSEHKIDHMTWCTKNIQEQYKCQNLTIALERDRALFDDVFLNVTCFMAYSADECIHHIDREKAHVTTLDAGDVFSAGRYNSLVPIMQEKFEGGFTNYYAVAVIKKDTLPDVHSIRDLKRKKACFPWVGSLAGWTVPIFQLQQTGGMEVVDCNNQVKTAANFFEDSCAVYSLIDKYNPIGDNSDKLCALCTGHVPGGRCTSKDPYYGYNGAFRCLLETGDVAFLRHSTVTEMIQGSEFNSISEERFELLCLDGRRTSIREYQQCNWGIIPSDAVVTSSARPIAERKRFQKFLERLVDVYATKSTYSTTNQNNPYDNFNRNNNNDFYNRNSNEDFNNRNNFNNNNNNNNNNDYNRNNYDDYNRNNDFNNQGGYNFRNQNNRFNTDNRFGRIDSGFSTSTDRTDYNESRPYEKFDIFDSKLHGLSNLMFQDVARSLVSIKEDEQSFSKYLNAAMDYIYGIRRCPVGRMTLCVTSDPEYEKCVKMRTALKAQLLKPELLCYKAHSHINCMQAITANQADIAVFDAGDVYTGGLTYNLVPFMSEVYNLGEPEYYVVAIGKEEDPDTELTYLKGKSTCHTGINTAAGWTYPLAYLISNGWMRPYGCNSVRAAAEYFTKSCVPGAISSEYNPGVPYNSMCDLCHGISYRYCRRDASEDYYGHTGAFRCLVEGGGHVAFVKHTTVMENTGGKRKEWWARNTLQDEFELLCPDGTRAELTDFEKCNLGKVAANAIVTRGGYAYNETYVNAYINLLQYAQQLYGRKDVDAFSFSMFESPSPYYDLIFQDATRQIRVIPPEKRSFDKYLGGNFLRARRITDCFAGTVQIKYSIPLIILAVAVLLNLI